MPEIDDYAAALAAEYGQYRAVQAIDHDGARAYNKGDAVPASNVEAHGYEADGLVEKVSDTPPEPASAPAASTSAPVGPSPSPSPTPNSLEG